MPTFITFFILFSSYFVYLMNLWMHFNINAKLTPLENFCDLKTASILNNKGDGEKYIDVLKMFYSINKLFINGEIIFSFCFLSFMSMLFCLTSETKYVLLMGIFNVINNVLLLADCNINKKLLNNSPLTSVIDELDEHESIRDKDYKPSDIIPYVNDSLRKAMCRYAFLSVSSAVMCLLALANITLAH